MESQATNKTENKNPNYLKRISTLEKEVNELKTRINALNSKIISILNALKRK